MNYLKNIGISFGFMIGGILVFTLLATLLHYMNWIGSSTLSIFEILIPLLSMFLGGYQIGKRSKQKGWLEGLKLGLIFLVILILFQYLGLRITFTIKTILFYLLILASSIFGSMIGINKRSLEK